MFLTDMFRNKTDMITAEKALPGRDEPLSLSPDHFVSGVNMVGPHPEEMEVIYLGMGCFWGAERIFWQMDGVYVTAVGYAGGFTKNPTYNETCTGQTGHAEVVKIVYDPAEISLDVILKEFWEQHDPTQGMRQGNDIGTTYRSAIYTTSDAQLEHVKNSRDNFQKALKQGGHHAKITTEIAPLNAFYFAEDYHQQYLAKNPDGYCGLRGTGVSCPIPR
ncbi:peptide-methionine (S)-S-oxide reductase MsrA [Ahrensia marina]|uniref:Peptide methionine sulfoxide reductase MsrA n=1 Tax=Ahrensia marina TaxID=1514904 RepID=A0A0N1J6J2_9HYPH|nr:peptide-methionine (S)-S-oxide reductase MsrA [Ahrensia marina]KPB02224.1 peptide methionine sulfoxide reductase [Ahrensia marina]